MTRVIVLGPQQERRTVGETLAQLGLRGRIATVTAGWQEWESDDEALDADLGGRSVNLRLYARAEEVWKADPEFRAAHRSFQQELRHLRHLYNRRLEHRAAEWMELLDSPGEEDLLAPERADALASVRELDAHHLERTKELRAAFEAEIRPLERAELARVREEIASALDPCEALVIEGGHVALLHNRIRLFGLLDLLGDRPVLACSGGAMVLGERIVLFHDSPPWGPGHNEVALSGLSLYRGVLPFPHARERLRLDDPARVSRLATRLAPTRCVILSAGTRLDWDGSTWNPIDVERMDADGSIVRWEAAA